jgi:hypothetical protein
VGACRRRRREPVVRGDLRYLRADQHVGGSGWVAVVSVDRGGHCGSNGAKYNMAVAVLAEIWLLVVLCGWVAVAGWQILWLVTLAGDSALTSGSGWVAVVPLDRGGQGGSNGGGYNVAVAVLAELWLLVVMCGANLSYEVIYGIYALINMWVAVAGRQWYQSIEEVRAVRMVPLGMWQWQYWLSCGRLILRPQCGSGWVAVVPLERGGQGGSNGSS